MAEEKLYSEGPPLSTGDSQTAKQTDKKAAKKPKKPKKGPPVVEPHSHFSYELGQGFEGEFDFRNGEVSQSVPDAVIRVFPYKERVTRGRWKESGKVMMALAPTVELDPICTNMEINYNKRSHIGQFSGMFVDPDNELLRSIAPGDWMMIWMGPKSNMDTVRKQIKDEQPVNYFHSGLKFVGKVTSVRRIVAVQGNGMMSRRVSVTGASFAEFDTAVYFNQALIGDYQNGLGFAFSLSSSIEQYIADNGVLTAGGAIATFVSLFLGGGSGGTYNKELKKQISPNTSFWAPSLIGKLLNRKMGDKAKHFSYADMLTRMYGLHKYSESYGKPTVETAFKGFIPILGSYKDQKTYWTPYGIMGKFAPQITPWNGVPIWGILSQFLNPAVNEMYTTLRISPTGDITPHFIVRQIPFNTPEFAKAANMATSFLNLPRWKPQKTQLVAFDVGTSEALRNNFAYVRGQPVYRSIMEDEADIATINPQSDTWDIARYGLYPLLGTVASELSVIATDAGATVERKITDQQGNVTTKQVLKGNPNSFYTAIAADRGFGSHLKFTGSMTLKGVLEPIAVGDNLEYEGVVYHIEQLSHSLSVNVMGLKSFTTRISMSNGVDAITGGPPELANPPTVGDSSNMPATTFEPFED